MPSSPVASYVANRSGLSAPPQRPTIGRFAEKVRSLAAMGRFNTLPWLDPYTEETAAMERVYPVMMANPYVKQALLTKVHGVASQTLQTTPADSTKRDRLVSEFVRYNYTVTPEGGFLALAQEVLLHSLMKKNVACEKVWQPELWKRGKWRGKKVLRCLKAKQYVRLIQDEFLNVTHVEANGPNGVQRFPAGDFVIFKYLPLYQGAGMSDFRAAYGELWRLNTVEKLHDVWLELIGQPRVHAKYDSSFTIAPDPVKGTDGLPGLESDLSQMSSRNWLLTPASVQVEALNLATQAQPEFLAYEEKRERNMVISINASFLHMTTSQQGRGEMRGDSRTQKGSMDTGVWATSEMLCGTFNSQLTPSIVDDNFHDADYPMLSLGGQDYADMSRGMQVVKMASKDLGFKVSKSWFGKTFNVQEAETDDDILGGPPVGPQPPGLGRPRPGVVAPRATPAAPGATNGRTQPAQPFSDGTQEFCGGPGSGRPGPCPTGVKPRERKGRVRPDVARRAPAQRIAGTPDAAHRAAAEKWAAASPGLPPELSAEYADHMAHALSVLPAGVAGHAQEALGGRGVVFHPDLGALRTEATRLSGKGAAQVVGFAHDRGTHTDLHLDGGDDPRGTYVHELWHAADNGGFHSDDKGWQAAYKRDVLKGRVLLSRYAMTNPSEGFAEFGRVMAERGPDYMAANFPSATKHLRSKGLL